MPTWLLILIFIWLYLCFGFGILMFSQILASKTNDDVLKDKVSLDANEEADQTFMMIIVLFWPVISIVSTVGIIFYKVYIFIKNRSMKHNESTNSEKA